MICSVAVDLRISNVVDVPNYVVSALLPEAIFDGRLTGAIVGEGEHEHQLASFGRGTKDAIALHAWSTP